MAAPEAMDVQTKGILAIAAIANNIITPEIKKGIEKAAENANLNQAFTINYGSKSDAVVSQSIPFINANLLKDSACIKHYKIFKLVDGSTALYINVSWDPKDVSREQARQIPGHSPGFMTNIKNMFKFGKQNPPK